MNLNYFLCLIALVFSVTNFLYISVIPIILFPLSVGLIFYRKLILPNYIAMFCLLTTYILFSTILYDPSSLVDFDFYRRDGNFLITYGVFFSIYMIGCAKDPRHGLNISFLCILIISIFGLIFGHNEGGLVHFFFFEAHNAAGGFYGEIAALVLGFFIVNKSRLYLVYTVLFIFFLLMSDSRGTVIALVLAFLYYFFFKFKRPILSFFLFLSVQICIVLWSYPIWVQHGKFISDEATFDGAVDLGAMQRGGTIIDRVLYLWPRAFDNFLHSPVFGIGFGGYDDLNYRYLEIIPFISIKIDQTVRHSDAHAHNSYLTILSELGLVGFLLYFFTFYFLYKEINKIEVWGKDLCLALKFAFWVCIFSSGTEHRLTTPSQMLPFLIILAMSLSYNRYLSNRHKKLAL